MIGQRVYPRMHRPKGRVRINSLSLVVIGITLTVSACSYLPEYANPKDWFGSATDLVSGWWTDDKEKEDNFPNLASVPRKPELKSTVVELKNIKDKLISDRENARYSTGKMDNRRSKLWPNSPPPISLKATSARIPKSDSSLSKTSYKKSNHIASLTNPRKTLQKDNRSGSNLESVKTPSKVTVNQIIPSVKNTINKSASNQTHSPRSVSVNRKNSELKFSIKNDQEISLSSSDAKLKFNITKSVNYIADGIVNFGHGSAHLSSSALKEISRLAKSAVQEDIIIRIVGHASMRTREMDPLKHTIANFNISLKRANSVAEAFIAAGLPAERLMVDAVGDSQPLFSEAMPSGEKANRRTEIFLERS